MSEITLAEAWDAITEPNRSKMKRVIVESPYQATSQDMFTTHLNYARACMHDSLMRGEAPFLSHLLYTQVLNDDDPPQREIGLEAGFLWGFCAELVAVYIDFDISAGMQQGIQRYQQHGIPVEMRSLRDKDS